MGEPTKDLAIVLRSIPYEDRHRMVTALTEHHGRITAMAKNSIQSRRFGGSLDLFCAADWLFTERPSSEVRFLQEAQIRKEFMGLRQDLTKLACASLLGEVLLKIIPEHTPSNELFRLLANTLQALEDWQGEESPLVVLNLSLAKVLQWSGSGPQWEHCQGCGVTLDSLPPHARVVSQISEGGWICENCGGPSHSEHVLHVTSMNHLLLALEHSVREISTECRKALHPEARGLFEFLESWFRYHIPGFDQVPFKARTLLFNDAPTWTGGSS